MDIIVRVENIREVVKVMKTVEPGLFKQMQRDLKKDVQKVGTAIAHSMPDPSDKMSGVRKNRTGRSRWSRPRATVGFRPGSYKPGGDTHPLLFINLYSKPDAVLFHMGELAGLKNQYSNRSKLFTHWKSGKPTRHIYKNTPPGVSFIKNIREFYRVEDKAGTWAWPEFVQRYPQISQSALNILENYVDKLNRDFD